ncbi:MAG: hypothetical protein L6R41_001031 [Letrouitia leprolyta]|nr:MAG: hypothetical protein L6R41_001031 [Letrouitia leprolyta]
MASTHPESPRRHSVAIQDLLNPVGGDDESPPHQPRPHDNIHYSNNENARRRSSKVNLDRGHPSSTRSTSSGVRRSPPRGRERREFRPTYTEEEVNFIWYHREDLGWDWSLICDAFNRQFPGRDVTGRDLAGRDKSGIQCKYYRHLENNGVPQVRQRDRTTSAAENYGMRANTGLWYPWMR